MNSKVGVIDIDEYNTVFTGLGLTFETDIPIEEYELDVTIRFNSQSSLYNPDNYDDDCMNPINWCFWQIYKWKDYRDLQKERMERW